MHHTFNKLYEKSYFVWNMVRLFIGNFNTQDIKFDARLNPFSEVNHRIKLLMFTIDNIRQQMRTVFNIGDETILNICYTYFIFSIIDRLYFTLYPFSDFVFIFNLRFKVFKLGSLCQLRIYVFSLIILRLSLFHCFILLIVWNLCI